MKDFKKKLDADEHGGALMMGVTKPVIKAHGSSNAKAFKNAVRQAKLCVESGAVEKHARKAGRRGPDRGSRGVTAAGKARAARFRKTAPAGRPPSATKEGSGTMRETHELEEALHHHFKNPALLVTALTHTSYANEAKHGVRPQ